MRIQILHEFFERLQVSAHRRQSSCIWEFRKKWFGRDADVTTGKQNIA